MSFEQDHQKAARLLPWYANGTLEATDRREVANHLERCSACREELAFLGDVRAVLRVSAARDEEPPVARHAGFHSLPPELQQRVAAERLAPRTPRRLLVPAIAAGFVATIGLGVAMSIAWLDAPRYRTATSGTVNAEHNFQVALTFAPGASLQQLNNVLREHDAVIVRAPASDDRWLLEVPDERVTGQELLAHLASHEGVIRVEQLTGGVEGE